MTSAERVEALRARCNEERRAATFSEAHDLVLGLAAAPPLDLELALRAVLMLLSLLAGVDAAGRPLGYLCLALGQALVLSSAPERGAVAMQLLELAGLLLWCPAVDVMAIRAREQAATPGPWIDSGPGNIHEHVIRDQGGRGTALCNRSAADAAFIAAARADVPALLSALEQRDADIERLQVTAARNARRAQDAQAKLRIAEAQALALMPTAPMGSFVPPMLDASEPPSCLAGGVTTRADVAPMGLRALAVEEAEAEYPDLAEHPDEILGAGAMRKLEAERRGVA